MVPYAKHVGLWLLLFAGVCGIASNIAALFGYNGAYTFELVLGCIALSLVVGALSYRLANKKATTMPRGPDGELIPPRQPDSGLLKELSYQTLTKKQKLRLFYTYMASAIVFVIIDLVAYQTMLHFFPNLMPQMTIAVALAVSIALTALFGVVFYQRLTEICPDKK